MASAILTWAASTSHFATMAPAERESTLQQVHEFALRHPGLGDDDHFTMPFVTVTVRARAHR